MKLIFEKDFQAYLNVSKIVKNERVKEYIPNRYHHYGYKVSEHKYQQDLKEGKFQISDSFRKKLHESKIEKQTSNNSLKLLHSFNLPKTK